MTDDERRLVGLVNDVLFLWARSQGPSASPQEKIPEPLSGTPARIGPETRLGDLIGDMRFPTDERS